MERLKDAPLGVLLRCSSNCARRYLDNRIKDYGITPMQSRAMMVLYEHEGEEFSQKDLERALMLKGSTVKGIVDRLEEKGLISRRTCQVDGRRNNLILTEQGEQVRLRFKESLEMAESAMRGAFSNEELVQFREYLLRLIGSMEDQEV